MCVCVSHSVMSDSLPVSMDCSLPGSSVYGILQARILEWVATDEHEFEYAPGVGDGQGSLVLCSP